MLFVQLGSGTLDGLNPAAKAVISSTTVIIAFIVDYEDKASPQIWGSEIVSILTAVWRELGTRQRVLMPFLLESI